VTAKLIIQTTKLKINSPSSSPQKKKKDHYQHSDGLQIRFISAKIMTLKHL